MLGMEGSWYLSSISYYVQQTRNLILMLEVIQFLTKWFIPALMMDRVASIHCCLSLGTVDLVSKFLIMHLALDRQCYPSQSITDPFLPLKLC